VSTAGGDPVEESTVVPPDTRLAGPLLQLGAMAALPTGTLAFILAGLVGASGCSGADDPRQPDGDGDADADADSDADADAEPDAGADADADGDADPPRTWWVDDLGDGARGAGTEDDPLRDLQVAIDAAHDGDMIAIADGRYVATPRDLVDPTCGNCADEDFRSDIPVTAGFVVQGKTLHLGGASREGAVLVTGAGYGLLFEDAGTSSVETLTVTGGLRDADGRATDGGVVVRRTTLAMRGVDVAGNDDLYDGDPDPVVGVAGVVGREGADLTIEDCRIEDNSWDGIALYRGDPAVPGSGPRALVVGTTVGCDSQCVSPRGRGVGIGVTWDAEATVIGCRIHDQWKGVGAFGTSRVVLTNSIVEDQVGWGVIATGESWMEVTNNVITRNGTTGLAAWDPAASGRFVNNVVTGNGWSADEWVGKRTGVWMNSADVELAYNDVWDNATEEVCTGGLPGGDACLPVDFLEDGTNLSEMPRFRDTDAYEPLYSSPLVDRGDPALLDPDGSRSDLGVWGGPAAAN
jgi:hypothetical protein